MEAFLPSHAQQGYVSAFRWTVLVLAAITALAGRVFVHLRHDRPPQA
jgi:hypothetical protein